MPLVPGQPSLPVETPPGSGPNPGYTPGKPPPEGKVVWAKPGKWRSYLNKPIPNPPAGTFTYGTPTGTNPGDQSGDRPTNFAASKDAAVWAWMLKYFDDGSLKKKWGSDRPDHPSLQNQYGALLGDQRKKIHDEVPQPDPGRADAGIGPLPVIGDIFAAINKLIGALLNAQFWLRFGEVLLGLLLVGVGAAKLSDKAAQAIRHVPLAGKVIA